jgi:cysteine desulfurase family protein
MNSLKKGVIISGMIYLDNAATTYPKPEGVYRRIDGILRTVGGSPGRASHRMALDAARVVFNARESISKLIGCPDSSRIVFTKNATEAINIALKGLLKPADHVVTTTFEHNAVANTILSLEANGVEATRLRPDKGGFISPDGVERALTSKTRMVCISHASNVFGTIQDAAAIGRLLRDRGVLFMLDAAQTIGALEIDVEKDNIDILAATGHKALFGPQGTGFLYLREGVEPETIISGGTGVSDEDLEIPERLEAGTMNTPGIGALAAGVEFILSEGMDKIREHETRLVGELLEGLLGIEGVRVIGTLEADKRVGLVSFTMEGITPTEAGLLLDHDFSIMVRTGTHCAPSAHTEAGTMPEGAIRVSPSYLNTVEEIKKFIDAIKTIAGGD